MRPARAPGPPPTAWLKYAGLSVDPEKQKEQFQQAWTRAVAAAAGVAVSEPSVDDDSVDIELKGGPGWGPRRPRLEAQLKCTQTVQPGGGDLQYPLKIKNYNDLRPEQSELLVPRILIVLIVPTSVDDWLAIDDHQLVGRHCGYWVSLRGAQPTTNTTTVTVTVPGAQRLDRPGVEDLMTRIANGNWP